MIDHEVFQRLRRIRQLGLTELVYPGATHTRFEHALGTMHFATKMSEAIVNRQKPYLVSERGYDQAGSGIERDKRVVRFAALLHDVGHSPFSHSGESLFPMNEDMGRRFQHEDYSSSIIRTILREAIEDHQNNDNHGITADDVADLIDGEPTSGNSASARRMIWRPLISSQLDADRCDYLLRDSLHAGVSYGRYDLDRILVTLTLGLNESDDPVVAIEEGGWHAAEGLILARYMMFTQVYFQHTRLALDHHIEQVLTTLLGAPRSPGSEPVEPYFPLPTSPASLREYVKWDDWKVLGHIADGEAGDHGQHILQRDLYKSVKQTNEAMTQTEMDLIDTIIQKLGSLVGFVSDATKSWYSLGDQDLQIVPNDTTLPQPGRPLSQFSRVVANLSPVAKQSIYVHPSNRMEANRIIAEIEKGVRNEVASIKSET